MFLIPSALLHTVKSDEKKDLGQGQYRLVQFGCHIGSGGVRFPFSGSGQATMILQGQRENEQDVKPLQRHQLQSDNRHSPRCLSLIPVWSCFSSLSELISSSCLFPRGVQSCTYLFKTQRSLLQHVLSKCSCLFLFT